MGVRIRKWILKVKVKKVTLSKVTSEETYKSRIKPNMPIYTHLTFQTFCILFFF